MFVNNKKVLLKSIFLKYDTLESDEWFIQQRKSCNERERESLQYITTRQHGKLSSPCCRHETTYFAMILRNYSITGSSTRAHLLTTLRMIVGLHMSCMTFCFNNLINLAP